MKDKIIIFIIGVLTGAVIASGAFVIYSGISNSNDCNIETNGEFPREMPSENGQPPEIPNDKNNENSKKTKNHNSENSVTGKTKENSNSNTNETN